MSPLDPDFILQAMPISIATALPLISGFKLVWLTKRAEATPIQKLQGGLFLLQAIHCINFALFRENSENQIWGWSVSYALYQAMAMTLPALVIEHFHRDENKRLNDIVECKTQKLRHEVTVKRNLMMILVHDISNPLTSIMGNMLMYRRNKQEKHLKNIEEASKIIESLVNQVRNYEAIESGKKSFQKEPIAMESIITDIRNRFESQLSKKNLSIEYIDYSNNAVIYVDKDSFVNSVMCNIISNSIKFSYEGGRIIIGARHLGNNVLIDIYDNGMGMPKEILENIFSISGATNRKGTYRESGSGFGMIIVKFIVQAHGGEIHVESQQEADGRHGWTRVCLVLPMYL